MNEAKNRTEAAPVAVAAKPSAPPAPSLTDNNGRLELVRPTIEFSSHIFLDPGDSRTQLKRHTPENAYVEDGMLVIEELGIALPIASVALIRFGKKVSK